MNDQQDDPGQDREQQTEAQNIAYAVPSDALPRVIDRQFSSFRFHRATPNEAAPECPWLDCIREISCHVSPRKSPCKDACWGLQDLGSFCR